MTAARKGWDLAATLPTSTGDDLRLLADRAGRTARSVADQVVVSGGPLSPLMVGRSLARRFETDSFDLGTVRRSAKALSASRNAVFVAGVTGGLLGYHERMGAPCDALRMATPLSLRSSAAAVGAPPRSEGTGSPGPVVVPLGPGPGQRATAAVGRSLAKLAAEPGLSMADGLAARISLLPASVLVPALRAQARTSTSPRPLSRACGRGATWPVPRWWPACRWAPRQLRRELHAADLR